MDNSTKPIQTITFAVSDVAIAANPLYEMKYPIWLAVRLYGPAMAYSHRSASLIRVNTSHSFLVAAFQAFKEHRPLIISPDHIWLLILQAFAVHVRQNAEELRHKFVAHDGKKELIDLSSG